MHLKDLLGSFVRVGYCIPVPDFYLVLYGLRCRKITEKGIVTIVYLIHRFRDYSTKTIQAQREVHNFEITRLNPQLPNTYTIMLLIGICINLTKKPMNPMIANPIAVAMAIF